MLTEKLVTTPRPTRRWYFWLWLVGWLLAIAGLWAVASLRPNLEIPLLPGQGETSLSGMDRYVTIKRDGFTGNEPSFQSIEGGITAQIRVRAIAYNEISLELTARGGPALLKVNGQSAGTIPASSDFKTYRFNFTAPRQDGDDVPYIHINLTPATRLDISAARLDFSAPWQPFLGNANKNSLILIALYSLLAVLSAAILVIPVSFRWPAYGLMLVISAGVTLLAGVMAGQVLGAGFSGDFNMVVFGGLLLGLLFLIVFGPAWALAGMLAPTGISLFGYARHFWQAKISPRPTLQAFLVIALANTGLMLLFYGVLVVMTGGWDYLARFWDGPEYLVNAVTLYDPHHPALTIPFFAQKSEIYWGAHFPGYSLVIRLFAPLFGYVASMFVINFLATIGFGVALFRLLRDFGYSRYPLWLSVLALFLPLRWLIYHSVGASEALTLLLMVLSFYAFKKEQWWLAGLYGAGVVVTRPNGFFLLGGFGLFLLWQVWEKYRASKKPFTLNFLLNAFNWPALPGLMLMPLALLAVFALYGWRYGDFFAYLRIPEEVTHIYPIPLLSMDVSVTRSEGDFYYYILQAAGLVLLWQRKQYDVFWVGLVLYLPTLFLLHDDVLRYSLPAFPFVLLIPFAAVLSSKYARWFALPALFGVLIYSWSQLNTNLVDFGTWQALLNQLK